MKIKSRAWAFASGIGLIITIAFSSMVAFFTARMFNLQPGAAFPTDGAAGLLMGLSALSCFVPLLVYALVGLLYAMFHSREDAFDRIEDVILGGAVSAVTVAILSTIVSTVVSAVMMQSYIQESSGGFGPELGIGVGISLLFGLFTSILTGSVGGIVGSIFGGLIWREKD